MAIYRKERLMSSTTEIEGLHLRLRPVRRPGYQQLTYVEVHHDGHWLNCGDPVHGDLSKARARAALAHYARVAIRKAQEAPLPVDSN